MRQRIHHPLPLYRAKKYVFSKIDHSFHDMQYLPVDTLHRRISATWFCLTSKNYWKTSNKGKWSPLKYIRSRLWNIDIRTCRKLFTVLSPNNLIAKSYCCKKLGFVDLYTCLSGTVWQNFKLSQKILLFRLLIIFESLKVDKIFHFQR